jgi:hypothetical protein
MDLALNMMKPPVSNPRFVAKMGFANFSPAA